MAVTAPVRRGFEGFSNKSRWHEKCSFEAMDKEELQERSLKFAADIRPITQRVRAIPGGTETGDQLLDCSASMAANYRAACRGRSTAEFIAKLGTVVEESDETVFWLEYIVRSGFLRAHEVASHLDEAKQLRAIFAASYATARSNYRRRLEEQRRKRNQR